MFCKEFLLVCILLAYIRGFPGGLVIKNPPAMQETQEKWVGFLGQEDPLEKEIGTHSSILAGEILWIKEPGGLQFRGCKELDRTEHKCRRSSICLAIFSSTRGISDFFLIVNRWKIILDWDLNSHFPGC